MASGFIIFAVLATLALISSAEKFETKSSDPKDSHKDPTTLEKIQALEKIAVASTRTTIVQIFDPIKTAADEIAKGNHYKIGHDHSATEKSSSDAYEVAKKRLDARFEALVLAQPEGSSIVKNIRCAVYTEVRNRLSNIRTAIDLAYLKNSTEVRIKFEKLEKDILAVTAGTKYYDAMLNGRDSSSATGAKIISAREYSDPLVVEVFKDTVKAIRLLLTKAFPDIYFKDLDKSLTIEALEKRAISTFAKYDKSLFAGIDIVYKANSEKKTETCGHPDKPIPKNY